MEAVFYKEANNIYRLKVPFDNLYTSVFLLKTKEHNILVDCATTDKDVEEYILPALENSEISIENIHYLILTHRHGDHAGGKEKLLQLNPCIKPITEACKNFSDGITLCELKGHTLDCIGVFDERSGTLISGDGLQGCGVGKYRCSLESMDEYIKTIERIKNDKRIKNILFSHAYEPWKKDGAFGRAEVERCLQDCIDYLKEIKK